MSNVPNTIAFFIENKEKEEKEKALRLTKDSTDSCAAIGAFAFGHLHAALVHNFFNVFHLHFLFALNAIAFSHCRLHLYLPLK